jgi:arylsulfatase A-like enzyme
MRTRTPALVLLLAAAACAPPPPSAAPPPSSALPAPHIIHIMGDDVGWNDLSYHHKSLSHSPNLDRLATGGVRLRNHHAFKVCGPSRSAFHTGRLPWQMGYYDNSAAAVPWLDVDSNRMGASLDFTLLPQVLGTVANYTSHAIGKWHLGHVTRAHTPTYRGYKSFLGYYDAMTEDYWAHTHSTGHNAPGGCPGTGLGRLWNALSNNSGAALGHSLDNGTYESTLFGDHAVRTIEQHDPTTPLFMYLAFHNEHDPHQAPKDAIDKYGGGVKSDTYKVTVAQIATMDEQVGRVVAALNASGMLDNAIISFSSDNGGPLDHANNFPRRGGKHGFYEGGIRTEAFVWSSSRIPQARRGGTYDGLMHLADWRSTLAGGLVGASAAQLNDGAPFAAESHDHWAAILGEAPCPRSELIHNVQ